MPLIDKNGKELKNDDLKAILDMMKGSMDGHIEYMKQCKETLAERKQDPEFFDDIIARYNYYKDHLEEMILQKKNSKKKIKAEDFIAETYASLSDDIVNHIDRNSKGFRFFKQSVSVSMGDLNLNHKIGNTKIQEMIQNKKESYDISVRSFKFADEPLEGIEDIRDYNPNSDSVAVLYEGRMANSTSLKTRVEDLHKQLDEMDKNDPKYQSVKVMLDDTQKAVIGLHIGAESSRMYSSQLMNKKNITFADMYDIFSNLNKSVRAGNPNAGNLSGQIIQAGKIIGVGSFKNSEVLYKTLSNIADYMNQIKKVENPALRKTRAVQLAAFAYQMTLSEHVFKDGNGRTCRLFADTILQTFGLPPHTPVMEEVDLSETLGFPMDFNKGTETFLQAIKVSENLMKQEEEVQIQQKVQNSKKETRASLLEELRAQALAEGNELKGSELYKNYTDAIEVLDNQMNDLENHEGAPKALDENDKKSLLEGLLKVAEAGETFLAKAQTDGKNLNKGIYKSVSRLQNLLAKDYNQISSYDPKTPQTLPELQENSRTLTIDFRKRSLKTLGNMQSSRIPMTVHTANGKKRTGVFTKASYVDATSKYDAMIKKAKTQCNPQGAEVLDHLLDSIKTNLVNRGAEKRYHEKIKNDEPREFILGWTLYRLRNDHDKKKKGNVTKGEIKRFLTKRNINIANISDKAFDTLRKGFDSLIDDPGIEINSYELELRNGDRIDHRNSAMSAIANLLGCGDLLAKSESMRYIDENGNVVEGTFMDFGKGADIVSDYTMCKHVSTNPYKNANAKNRFYKSIADLQIIDAIAKNRDRHEGNLLYTFDENGNVTGVQGIDNDSSCGKGNISIEDAMDLRVVSQSMADRMKKITPAMLKFALRGRGLTSVEIDSAVERFNTLKTYIEGFVIKPVQDKEFSNLTDEEIIGVNNENLFNRAVKAVNKAAMNRHDLRIGFEPFEQKKPTFSKISTTDRKFIIGGLVDITENVGRLLDNKETGFKISDIDKAGRRSGEFTNIIEAAKTVEQLPANLKKNKMLKEKQFINDNASAATVERMDLAFQHLKEEVLKYLRKKTRQRGLDEKGNIKGKNEYEQKRIDYAKNMLKVVKEYEKVRKGPQTVNERIEERNLVEARKNIEKKNEVKQPVMGGK